MNRIYTNTLLFILLVTLGIHLAYSDEVRPDDIVYDCANYHKSKEERRYQDLRMLKSDLVIINEFEQYNKEYGIGIPKTMSDYKAFLQDEIRRLERLM